jgi:3-(3-hydroxy-phenyl)propionate hydroxylase
VIRPPEQARGQDEAVQTDLLYLAETDGLFAGWMAQHGCAAVVVRPDRYVFGTANNAAQLNRLVVTVGGYVLAG